MTGPLKLKKVFAVDVLACPAVVGEALPCPGSGRLPPSETSGPVQIFLGHGNQFPLRRLPDPKGGLNVLPAKLAIEDELAALKTEVDGFMASPPDRTSTLVRRLDAFEGLQARANLNRDVLQVHVADLEVTHSGLTASVESLLNQKAAA